MSDSLTKIRKLTPLLDCDLIVYRVGFAAEKDEPIENVLHSVKMVVANALAPFDSKAELYISGSGNFRNEIAKTKPYKGNRLDTPKPQYYNEIREYLIKYHKAIPTDGIEPDDMQGIRQYELKGKSCIISIDKDMKMIKGWHYNFVKGEAKFIDGLAAERWFFTQLLTGDPTDNIQGVPKIGPKTADFLYIDELREWTQESFTAALPVTRARPNAMTLMTSNAGDGFSTVLNDLRERCLSYPPDNNHHCEPLLLLLSV